MPSNLGMLLLPIWCPISHNAAASFAWLFDTHSSGRIGSPIVAGSSNRRRSSSSVGSFDGQCRPAAAWPPNLARQRAGVIQVLQSTANRAARDPCCPRRLRRSRHGRLSAPPPPRTDDEHARSGHDQPPHTVRESLMRLPCGDGNLHRLIPESAPPGRTTSRSRPTRSLLGVALARLSAIFHPPGRQVITQKRSS